MALNPHYNPQDWEQKIYQQWEQSGAFKAVESSSNSSDLTPSYAIILPPPNVTGALHIGHALNHSIQDCLIRWQRMRGLNTLWLPGSDHAGIATQGVVERELAQQNLTRQQLGREKFVDRVWQWKHEYGDRICQQMRLIGDSCDWQRHVFTLDKGVSRAVREVFVSLYNKGLIYRGLRMVNWSCKLQSAISDLEVEHKQSKGHLWHIKYPIVNSREHLIVATTRPETLFADTAVAVAPNDERYKHLIGQQVQLPLCSRLLPVVADEVVKSEFGSGVVKITPAHDFNDYQVGVRHKLPMLCILSLDGKLKNVPPPYQGLGVQEARKLVIQNLEQQNLLHKTEDYMHSVGYCSRSGCVIEPMLSKQWFIKAKALAGPAKAAVENGTTSFEPELWTKTYLHWLNNIEDWCISRQLWWGHQIPAWYCPEGHENVAQQGPAKCNTCGSSSLKQDEDVLDTWFSSALWPFSTLGWPNKTQSLKTFYPTQCLVTGHDIIFFWVARMMMMGLEFCGDVPFRKVYVHGLVRDAKGQKMSKSLGNSVDPVKVVEKHGADTLRLACLSYLLPGRDLKLGSDKLEVQRNFINKLWNAARFALSVLPLHPSAAQKSRPPITNDLDAWVVQRLNTCIAKVNTSLKKYRFDEACTAIYNFIWHEFCDWYLEMIKNLMYSKSIHQQKQNTQQVLLWVLDSTLRLWHPFCPFVTEHIYQQLPHVQGGGVKNSTQSAAQINSFLMLQKYPTPCDESGGLEASDRIDLVRAVIRAIRTWRAENKITFAQKLKLQLVCEGPQSLQILQKHKTYIINLGGLSECVVAGAVKSEQACSVWPVRWGEQVVKIVIPLEGVVDFDFERARIEKNLKKLAGQQGGLEKRLANENFTKQAPPKVVAELRARLQALNERHTLLEANLKRL